MFNHKLRDERIIITKREFLISKNLSIPFFNDFNKIKIKQKQNIRIIEDLKINIKNDNINIELKYTFKFSFEIFLELINNISINKYSIIKPSS